MSKQMWWAGWAVALTMAVSGCKEVKHCKEGTAGCLNGAPKDGKCLFDLENVNGKCVEPGKVGDGGTGDQDSGTDAGTPCDCPGTASCATDTGECVDFCEQPDGPLPGSLPKPEAIFCEKAQDSDPNLTYEEVCIRHCKLQCQRWSWFCGHDCAATECADGDGNVSATALAACLAIAPADAITDLQSVCNNVRGWGCGDTVCPSSNPPASCEGIRCDNNSDKCGYTFDSWCDDGDTFNTHAVEGSNDSATCTWGSDCADCGPRRKTDVEPVNLPQGALCNWNTSCAGYKQILSGNDFVTDLETNKAWCVSLPKVLVGLNRCVPDCSGAGETCPDGYDCVELAGDVTMNGMKPRACLPPCANSELP